jgi:erythromycin esterase
MSRPIPTYTTLDEWITHEAIPFDITSSQTLEAAIDTMLAALGEEVEVLGFGEALHGGEEILILRNRLFQHLVTAHGYTAIAIESSFTRGYAMNEFVAGRGPSSYETVREIGISHGWGKLEANRELVEWMRHYNANPAHPVKLRFYGFDSPTESYSTDSPGPILHFVLDYLTSMDQSSGQKRRDRITPLIGSDSDWENPAAIMDPTKSIGLSPAANALRLETEALITELRIRRPEWIAKSDADRYLEALQYALVARELLNYHAALARHSDERLAELLGIRDAMMADNLVSILARERGRGKVLAFAHNSHLKRGRAEWQIGNHLHLWWPAGAHLDTMLGPRYAVIGSAVGVSTANGISQPATGTLESSLMDAPGPARFIPTHRGAHLPAATINTLPVRSGSRLNPSYFPLTPESFTDFDGLALLDSTTYQRGGPVLQEWVGNTKG